MKTSMTFVNLHGHSTFSFLMDGYGSPASHCQRAAELGYSAMALTEHGNVSSAFQFEKAAIKAGIKPIFGMECYCGSVLEENDDARLVMGSNGEVELRPARGQYKHHLTIIAENASGYRSLNRIVTRSYLDYYYHPTVSGDSLADNSDGIIVLSGCSGSLLACSLLGGKGTPDHIESPDFEAAEQVIENFRDLFGDRYFLEIQPFYELPRSCAMNRAYERLSKKFDIPLVVTHDVHYPEMADAEMQAVLHAVGRGKASVDDALRSWNYDVPLTLPSSDKALAARLRRTGISRDQAYTAIDNSAYVGSLCNVTLPKAERLRYTIADGDLEPWILNHG
jgi:DNA polymerase-3 subunit alpha